MKNEYLCEVLSSEVSILIEDSGKEVRDHAIVIAEICLVHLTSDGEKGRWQMGASVEAESLLQESGHKAAIVSNHAEPHIRNNGSKNETACERIQCDEKYFLFEFMHVPLNGSRAFGAIGAEFDVEGVSNGHVGRLSKIEHNFLPMRKICKHRKHRSSK